MASYHFRATIIGRKKGYSAVAAAAYRAGEKLVDERDGKIHDYSRRKGVEHSEIMLPKGANPKLGDRSNLWNVVEASEKRFDSQLCRSVVMALPFELTDEQRLDLTRDFVQEQFVRRGMIADVAIHAPVADKGEHHKNHHAHVLLTLREAEGEGLRATKTREWNSHQLVDDWREEWATAQNVELEKHGHKDRVDHRTLEEQRDEALEQGDHGKADALDREPEESLGHELWNMLKEGKIQEGIEEAETGFTESESSYSHAGHELAEFEAMADDWKSNYQPTANPASEYENWKSPQSNRLELKGALFKIYGGIQGGSSYYELSNKPKTAFTGGKISPPTEQQMARAERIRETLLQMNLTGALRVIYGKRSPEHFANQMKFEKFQNAIKGNRETMRQKRDLWQQRRALFAKRRSAYEGFFTSKKLGLDFGDKHEGMSEDHIVKRLYQVTAIQHQIEGALAVLSMTQLKLEMRQQQFGREIAPHVREMEQSERERPQREFAKSQRKQELEAELQTLAIHHDA